jgi:hypothetical protein
MENKPYIIELEKIGSPSLGYITVAEYQKIFLLILKEYIGLILHPTKFCEEAMLIKN